MRERPGRGPALDAQAALVHGEPGVAGDLDSVSAAPVRCIPHCSAQYRTMRRYGRDGWPIEFSGDPRRADADRRHVLSNWGTTTPGTPRVSAVVDLTRSFAALFSAGGQSDGRSRVATAYCWIADRFATFVSGVAHDERRAPDRAAPEFVIDETRLLQVSSRGRGSASSWRRIARAVVERARARSASSAPAAGDASGSASRGMSRRPRGPDERGRSWSQVGVGTGSGTGQVGVRPLPDPF